LIYRDKSTSLFKFDYNIITKAIPCGNLFPRMLSFLEIYSLEKIKTNFYDKKMFDYFAKNKIPRIKNGYLFTFPDYLQSIQQAKRISYKIILSVGCHPKWINDIAKQEYEKYNLPIHPAYEERVFKNQLKSLEFADYLVASTEFNKKTLVENGFDKDRIFLNPNGVNPRIFAYTSHKGKKMKFLFLSRITLMKGLQYLLEAWKNLKLSDAELIICGRCSADFRGILAKFLKNIENIKYVGDVSNPKEYYHSSSVFILPSLVEGMSRAVTEAMSSGLPVIVTPVSAPHIKHKHDGFLIQPQDRKSLEEAILYFYKNREEICRIGKNASNTARQLSWENHSNRMVEIFEKIFNTDVAK